MPSQKKGKTQNLTTLKAIKFRGEAILGPFGPIWVAIYCFEYEGSRVHVEESLSPAIFPMFDGTVPLRYKYLGPCDRNCGVVDLPISAQEELEGFFQRIRAKHIATKNDPTGVRNKTRVAGKG